MSAIGHWPYPIQGSHIVPIKSRQRHVFGLCTPCMVTMGDLHGDFHSVIISSQGDMMPPYLHVAIRNASAHKTHDQFTGVMLIHGVSPQVSRGRALKSFRMLLDRRRRLVNELCIIQLLSIILCSVSFLP